VSNLTGEKTDEYKAGRTQNRISLLKLCKATVCSPKL
jgi:hypothetical protein